ncbi:MAG: aminotransferase class III-fold pyridoxal phosphate-dependent enzyme, partial [Candidatus Fonsibacter ubiquis]
MDLNKNFINKDPKHKPNYKPNDLEAFWMPFTANQDFKVDPRIISKSKGMYYYTPNGDKILDAVAGLWCCNAGHNRDEIVKAIQEQAAELDFVPSFQMGHYKAFELSNKLTAISPENLNHVFYSNSGSEAVETALKIALAYFRIIGKPSKKILIGRERGYHGTGFGGLSVGGIVNNKKQIERFLPDVYHLPHTHNLEHNSYSKGQPKWGAHLADDLLQKIEKHGASNIAAVIVEPVAGSTGVLIPPVGYLEKLRKICTDNEILLIFDEVITGFGRLGKPFAADFFNIEPDLMAIAKGLTSGTVPMAATFVSDKIYKTFMNGDPKIIDFFHGYTYSAHPLACAAAIASLAVYQKDNLLNRVAEIATYWEDALHSLKGTKHIIDIRNLGLIGAVELESISDKPSRRAYNVLCEAFRDQKLFVRVT